MLNICSKGKDMAAVDEENQEGGTTEITDDVHRVFGPAASSLPAAPPGIIRVHLDDKRSGRRLTSDDE